MQFNWLLFIASNEWMIIYNNEMILEITFLVAYFLFNTLSMYSPVKALSTAGEAIITMSLGKNTSTASSFRCGKNGSNIG